MARWFRFYDEALDDPKVQRLSDALYRRWTDMLCIASRNAGRITGDIAALAFMIRQSPAKTKAAVTALESAGLLDRDGDGYMPHGWRSRQYDSDSSAERMRRHRNKRRDGESDGDVTSPQPSPLCTSDGAEQNRTEQIQNRAEQISESALARAATVDEPDLLAIPEVIDKRKATRLPEGWTLPDDWRRRATEARQRHGLPAIDVDLEADKFANYWRAKSGQGGTKLDWAATWQNWCLNAGTARAPTETARDARVARALAAITATGASDEYR